eukprot:Ihof_evm7s111 gene=Ihof_evmTU7s111
MAKPQMGKGPRKGALQKKNGGGSAASMKAGAGKPTKKGTGNKGKAPKPAINEVDSGSSDGEVDYEDLEDLDVNFLASMDREAISKTITLEAKQAELAKAKALGVKQEQTMQKRKRKEDSEDEEMVHEKKPRSAAKIKDEPKRMPIKVGARIVAHELQPESKEEKEKEKEIESGSEEMSEGEVTSEDEDEEIEMEEGEEEEEEEEPEGMTAVQIALASRATILKAKDDIARISLNILADSDANINDLKKLHAFAADGTSDGRIRKMAIVSLLSVFKDILPGYRMRLPTNEEKKVKLSKEVKKLRLYEGNLLGSYQKYLQLLHKFLEAYHRRVKAHKEGKVVEDMAEIQGLATLSVRCLCDMLLARVDFNFTNNIIQTLLPAALSQLPEALPKVCETLRELFARDTRMFTTLETVRTVANLAKSHNYNIPPELVETFDALIFSEELLDTSINPINNKRSGPPTHISRKSRKKNKEDKLLEQELEMASAENNKQEMKRTQTEILKLLFLTYFRVLKTSGTSPMLPAVLKGLSLHAHLINVDFFVDLLATLSHLLSLGNLSYESSLHCVQTAFAIVTGQGAVLTIDTKDVFTHLYALIAQAPAQQQHLPLLVKCLMAMQSQNHMLTISRVASFVKRIFSVVLQLSGGNALGLMAMANNLMQRQARVLGLLESEGIGAGIFLPEATDPETANAIAGGLWELHMLRKHPHPAVALMAQHLMGKPQTDAATGRTTLLPPGLRKAPGVLLQEYDNSKGGFNPQIQPPRQHPRAKALAKVANGGEMVFACLRVNDDKEAPALPVVDHEKLKASIARLLKK